MRIYKMVLSCFFMFYHVLSIYPYYFKEKLTSLVSISVTTDSWIPPLFFFRHEGLICLWIPQGDNGAGLDINSHPLGFSNLEATRWHGSTCGWENLPSGYVKIAIENGHRNSEFSHEKKCDFPSKNGDFFPVKMVIFPVKMVIFP